MEKVKVKTCVKVENKNFFNMSVEDGRAGSTFDEKFLELIGQEVEVELKDSGREYPKGTRQWYFSLPKEQKGNKGWGGAPKDYKFEKQNQALNHAINSLKLTDAKVSSENIIALADKYYGWFNSK